MTSAQAALARLCDPSAKVSAHYTSTRTAPFTVCAGDAPPLHPAILLAGETDSMRAPRIDFGQSGH